MATYAIGDIQGCFASLQALLLEIAWDPTVDRLWLAGDLFNRGPDSLGVARWFLEHREVIDCVLGNHELHLLGIVAGHRKPKGLDTLDALLAAPWLPELIEELRRRPFVHAAEDAAMVHAGFLPGWTGSSACPGRDSRTS